MELIDREAVKDITKKGKIVIDEGIFECENLREELVYILKKVEEFLEKNIESIPTIESRPRGEWIKSLNLQTHFKCSVCGYLPLFKTKFCSECGADMRSSAK